MQTHPIRHNRGRSDTLHPRIYQAAAALALWLVLSVWFFFATGPYTSLTLAVVSGFMLVAVGLPFILSRVGDGLDREDHRTSLRDWSHAEFGAWGTRLSGAEAATQVLLPIAAVSIGMTLIGVAFTIASSGSG
jgi:hypothetical protein